MHLFLSTFSETVNIWLSPKLYFKEFYISRLWFSGFLMFLHWNAISVIFFFLNLRKFLLLASRLCWIFISWFCFCKSVFTARCFCFSARRWSNAGSWYAIGLRSFCVRKLRDNSLSNWDRKKRKVKNWRVEEGLGIKR